MPIYEVRWREYTEHNATVAANDEDGIAEAVAHLSTADTEYEILDAQEIEVPNGGS